MKITDEQIGAASGTVVAVDGGVLLAYVRASRRLHDAVRDDDPPEVIAHLLSEWELAHVTFCGNFTGA